MGRTLPRRKRVALDCRLLIWPGIGRYCQELAAALPEVAPDLDFRWLCTADQAARLHSTDTARPIVVKSRGVSLAEQIEIPGVLLAHGIALLHAPVSHTVPVLTRRLIVTVHDFIIRRFPESLPSLMGRAYYRAMNNISIKRAARVITVSDDTRKHLLGVWKGAESKTRTIHNGVSASFKPVGDPQILARVRASYGLPDSFILYVGARKHHKNLPRLLEAYAATPPELRLRTPLVLVMRPDRRYPNAEETVRRTGIGASVFWPPRVLEADMAALYSMARFLVLPSLMEGFGLPLLEAMACGTPCLAARVGALEEIGGDATAYADPLDTEDLGRGLIRMMQDEKLRRELGIRGLARAKQFTWRETALEVAALYREVLQSS